MVVVAVLVACFLLILLLDLRLRNLFGIYGNTLRKYNAMLD